MRWSDREVADGVVVALLGVGEGQAGVAGTDPLGTLTEVRPECGRNGPRNPGQVSDLG